MTEQALLQEVDDFLAETGMAETTLGRLAVNDGKFIPRLRKGGRTWPETARRVRKFMAERRSPAPTEPEGAAA